MPALLCIAYTVLLIGAAWWISRKLGNVGEDTSCDDPYLDSLAGEIGAAAGESGGGDSELLNGSRPFHSYDIAHRNSVNSR